MASADLTQLLSELSEGNAAAYHALLPQIYDTLRQIARQRLLHERADHTLTPTALVHEAYLKLVQLNRITWQDRAHFFAVASDAMRKILVSYAKQRNALKRGGGVQPTSLDEARHFPAAQAEQVLALDEALQVLAQRSPRQAQIVTLRFFGGMTLDETAAALDISIATVKRDWRLVRAWLDSTLRNSVP